MGRARSIFNTQRRVLIFMRRQEMSPRGARNSPPVSDHAGLEAVTEGICDGNVRVLLSTFERAHSRSSAYPIVLHLEPNKLVASLAGPISDWRSALLSVPSALVTRLPNTVSGRHCPNTKRGHCVCTLLRETSVRHVDSRSKASLHTLFRMPPRNTMKCKPCSLGIGKV